jgi:polyisoprenoid-binding protein YceI
MRTVTNIVAVLAALTLFGCKNASSSNQGTATTSGRTSSQNPVASGAAAITPENTTITFVGTKPNGKHDGGFKSFSGSIKPATGDFTASTITVEIDTQTLYSDNEKLTNHLKSPDFFEVKKYPKASFASTAIKAEQKDDATHVITGDLTLHGTTKQISFPAKVATTDDQVTLDSTFVIDRTDFGIAWAPDKVHKPVTIKVSLKVSRK